MDDQHALCAIIEGARQASASEALLLREGREIQAEVEAKEAALKKLQVDVHFRGFRHHRSNIDTAKAQSELHSLCRRVVYEKIRIALPREIRDHIYELLLADVISEVHRPGEELSFFQDSRKYLFAAHTTGFQVLEEIAETWYRSVEYCFNDRPTSLQRMTWLVSEDPWTLGLDPSELIRRVSIDLYSNQMFTEPYWHMLSSRMSCLASLSKGTQIKFRISNWEFRSHASKVPFFCEHLVPMLRSLQDKEHRVSVVIKYKDGNKAYDNDAKDYTAATLTEWILANLSIRGYLNPTTFVRRDHIYGASLGSAAQINT